MPNKRFGNNRKVAFATPHLDHQHLPVTKISAFSSIQKSKALYAAMDYVQKCADFKAQHGPVIRIDPVTGVRTVIENTKP